MFTTLAGSKHRRPRSCWHHIPETVASSRPHSENHSADPGRDANATADEDRRKIRGAGQETWRLAATLESRRDEQRTGVRRREGHVRRRPRREQIRKRKTEKEEYIYDYFEVAKIFSLTMRAYLRGAFIFNKHILKCSNLSIFRSWYRWGDVRVQNF